MPVAIEVATNIRVLQSNARFMARASLFLFGLSCLAVIASLLSFHVGNSRDWLVLLLLLLVSGICIGGWFCARTGWLLLAGWLLVVSLVAANTFLFLSGSDASFLSTLSVFMLAAILAMLTLGTRITYGVVIWGNFATLFLWFTNGIFIVNLSRFSLPSQLTQSWWRCNTRFSYYLTGAYGWLFANGGMTTTK